MMVEEGDIITQNNSLRKIRDNEHGIMERLGVKKKQS